MWHRHRGGDTRPGPGCPSRCASGRPGSLASPWRVSVCQVPVAPRAPRRGPEAVPRSYALRAGGPRRPRGRELPAWVRWVHAWGTRLPPDPLPSPAQSHWWDVCGITRQTPRHNPRVRDRFHRRAHGPFPAGTSSCFLTSSTPRFRRPRVTTAECHRCPAPAWPWLAPMKLCMYFVWLRVYIVMVSYAKKEKK